MVKCVLFKAILWGEIVHDWNLGKVLSCGSCGNLVQLTIQSIFSQPKHYTPHSLKPTVRLSKISHPKPSQRKLVFQTHHFWRALCSLQGGYFEANRSKLSTRFAFFHPLLMWGAFFGFAFPNGAVWVTRSPSKWSSLSYQGSENSLATKWTLTNDTKIFSPAHWNSCELTRNNPRSNQEAIQCSSLNSQKKIAIQKNMVDMGVEQQK